MWIVLEIKLDRILLKTPREC